MREWEQELLLLAHLDSDDAGWRRDRAARQHRPSRRGGDRAVPTAREGVGLFRTEFLVVGRNAVPAEEEQYRAYRQVVEAFPDAPGLHPHLRPGRRQVPGLPAHAAGGEPLPRLARHPRLPGRAGALPRRSCARSLRATAHGDVRIMLPLVNEISEIARTRELLDEMRRRARARGKTADQRRLHPRRHDRDARRRRARRRAGAARRLLLDRHQRPGAVHARRGPRQLPPRAASTTRSTPPSCAC